MSLAQQQNGCRFKKRYRKQDAKSRCRKLGRKENAIFRFYYCTFCYSFHISRVRNLLSAQQKKEMKNTAGKKLIPRSEIKKLQDR
jgi:predicted adenine nucleotide alpha hydrolase (AANH) superfamily ATPase